MMMYISYRQMICQKYAKTEDVENVLHYTKPIILNIQHFYHLCIQQTIKSVISLFISYIGFKLFSCIYCIIWTVNYSKSILVFF